MIDRWLALLTMVTVGLQSFVIGHHVAVWRMIRHERQARGE